MAATTLFTIGAGATCTDGVCGTVSRSAGEGTLSMSPVAAPAWPRVRLAFHRGTVTGHG